MTFESRYPNQLSNGLLGVSKEKRAKKLGFTMLSPLWTDNDARTGAVFYHIYDLTKPGSTAADKARVKVCERLFASSCFLSFLSFFIYISAGIYMFSRRFKTCYMFPNRTQHLISVGLLYGHLVNNPHTIR